MLLQQSATMRTCDLGSTSSGTARFWPKMGGQLGRKGCGWLKRPCMIPIPGFIILDCDPILILKCSCSSLQSCTHVIWARVALKLSVFGQIRWSAWHWMECLDSKTMYDSHPRLKKPCLWTNFEYWIASTGIWNHLHMSFGPKSALELLVFGQNWGSAWQNVLW